MDEFEKLCSKNIETPENNKDLVEYYTNEVEIGKWLTNNMKNSIIKFKDRTEYKKGGIYHRLNGPVIDFNDEELIFE